MAQRDLTKAQFDAACKREGFTPQGFLGYYSIGVGGGSVSIYNAGPKRRTQLAYLIQQRNRWLDANSNRR